MTLETPRLHVALAVSDLEASVGFYRTLFAQEPAKIRPGYAKFSVDSPRVNLTLNETDAASPPRMPAHYGVEVPTAAHVAAFHLRAQNEGLHARLEGDVSCCYAKMDKFWLADPDGHAWEVFAITEADIVTEPPAKKPAAASDDASCCEPTCCQ